MITHLSHVSIYVLDLDKSLEFYRDKLGFDVRNNVSMDNGFRWVTLSPKMQPNLEVVLMPVRESPMFPADKAAMLRQLIEAGVMGAGVMDVDDCQKTYDELKAKGVEFKQPPTERFYGVEAILKDNSGNWFSMCQRKPH
jgi:catechol 2,3-dioxygenase-like lactoylglutathione lyase family enzyme